MALIDRRLLSQVISARAQEMSWDSFTPTDWKEFAQQAQREGIAPLVYWVFSQREINPMPKSIREFFRAAYLQTWAKNQVILKELASLAIRFEEAGIEVVVLKGACFALTLYPDIGLRGMGDLDILVPADKITRAVEIAKTLGYADILRDVAPKLQEALNHEILMEKQITPLITLEIHRSLVADRSFVYAVPVEWFWSQTENLKKAGYANALMLSPIAQLLYASAHIALQHGEKDAPLRWYYDVDLLIRAYAERMDWDALLSQAKNFKWGSALRAVIFKTREYFDTPIPREIENQLANISDQNQKLVEMLKHKPATHILEEFQKMAVLNGRARLQLMWTLIFPDAAYMRWRYQFQTGWLLPAYYLIRWLGIFKDGVSTLRSLLHK